MYFINHVHFHLYNRCGMWAKREEHDFILPYIGSFISLTPFVYCNAFDHMSKKKDKKGLVQQPHDHLFQNTFYNKEAMLSFLETNLPIDLFNKIDLEKLCLTNKSFVDPVDKNRKGDLVFQTEINNQPGYLYLLAEHKSIEDTYVPLNFSEINIQLLRQHLKENGNGPIPIILNVCIHNENKAYTGSIDILSIFSDLELAESYMFDSFYLMDLHSTPETDLFKYKNIPFACGIIHECLFSELSQLFSDRYDSIVDFLDKGYINHADASFLHMLTADRGQDLFETIKKSYPEFKKTPASVAGVLRQEGMRIGQEKGRLNGEKEKALSIAKAMLLKNYALEDIMILTGLPESKIQQLS